MSELEQELVLTLQQECLALKAENTRLREYGRGIIEAGGDVTRELEALKGQLRGTEENYHEIVLEKAKLLAGNAALKSELSLTAPIIAERDALKKHVRALEANETHWIAEVDRIEPMAQHIVELRELAGELLRRGMSFGMLDAVIDADLFAKARALGVGAKQ